MVKTQYISLEALAATLGLPQKYLRGLANQGSIPFLDVNGRKRFSEEEVRISLTGLANGTKGDKGKAECSLK